jgi:ABC-type lipoprotein export system ATPase subunit
MVLCRKLCRWYETGAGRVTALHELDLSIADKEFVTITGPSGCGKSTLLHLLGGLDHPSSGEIVVGDISLPQADEKTLTRYRRHHLGLVFQFFNLLPTMNVLENVELPLLLQGEKPAAARRRAADTLALVGLQDRHHHFPHQLSGGQMQRAAIARALVHRPALLLADEPTGNLDSENAARVLQTLQEIAAGGLTTMIVVTHSPTVAAAAPRQLELLDGRLLPEKNPAAQPPASCPGVNPTLGAEANPNKN